MSAGPWRSVCSSPGARSPPRAATSTLAGPVPVETVPGTKGYLSYQPFLIHEVDPQSLPVVITIFTQVVRPSQNVKIIAGWDYGLTEWIIDDSYLVNAVYWSTYSRKQSSLKITWCFWNTCSRSRGYMICSFVHRRFKIYSIYAWVIPMLIVTCGHVVDHVDLLKEYKPSYASTICWLNNRAGLALFFVLPFAALFLENIVLFLIAVASMVQQKKMKRLAFSRSIGKVRC